jgi:hypothetical protein
MAEVALLARGFEVRPDGRVVVSDEESPDSRDADVLIGGPRAAVLRERYAPSELVAAVRQALGKA